MPALTEEKDPWAVVAVGEQVQNDPWAVVSIGEEKPQDNPWAVVSVGEQTAISQAPEPTILEGIKGGFKEFGKQAQAIAETGASLATGAIGFIPSLAAAGGEVVKDILDQPYQIPKIDWEKARKRMEEVASSISYQPKTPLGQTMSQIVGAPFAVPGELISTAGTLGAELAKKSFGGEPLTEEERQQINAQGRLIGDILLLGLHYKETPSKIVNDIKEDQISREEVMASGQKEEGRQVLTENAPTGETQVSPAGVSTIGEQLKAKQPEVYDQLKKEFEDAKGIRKNEGQVSEGRPAAEAGAEKGSTNLEQQTSGQPSGAEGQKGIEELKNDAVKVQEIARTKQSILNNMLNEVVNEDDLRGYNGNVKSVKSIVEKVLRHADPDYTVESIKDHTRGQLILKDFTDVPSVIESIRKRAVVKSTDAAIDKPLNQFGYRGVHLTIDMGDGINGEVQLHTKESLKVKDVTDEIYRKWRNITDEKILELTPQELAQYRADVQKSQALWISFWEGITPEVKAATSSAVKGLESVTMPTVRSSSPVTSRQEPLSKTKTLSKLKSTTLPLSEPPLSKPKKSDIESPPSNISIPTSEKDVKIKGNISTATTERGTKIDTAFAVVDINDLTASHDTALNANKDYPAELQPRERDRAASQLQIDKIMQKLNPEFLGESPKASEGAPIVGKDLIVESGNGRIIALKKGYESNHKNIEVYRQWLLNNAEKFGLDKTSIETVEQPILVRVRQTDVNRVKFAQEANEQSVASMSAAEQARVDAKTLTYDLMNAFEPGETGEINAVKNRDFIRAFLQKVIPANELGRYIDSNGNVSQEGIRRISNAIFAKAYGDPAIIEKFTESTDNNIRQIANVMVSMGPKFSILQDGINNGELHNLNIANDIAQAAKKISQLRESGKSFKDYLNQGALFDDGITPLSKDVIGIFDYYKRNPKKLKAALDNYIEAVNLLGSPKQEALFGMKELPTRAEILQAAIKKMEVDVNVQTTLFKGEDAAGYEGVSAVERKKAATETPEGGKEVGGAATADVGQYTKTERQAIELPEIVELGKELMEGKFPYIKQKLRAMQGMAAGVFSPKKGNIGLKADIFKDAHEASRVVAHEIGHLVDWLPDRYIQRGNLLGRIATLNKYMKESYQGLMSNFEIRDELKALTQIIKPFDENANRKFTKYRYSSKELYADAFSTLINDPALLKKTAPNFYQGLFEYFDRKPEVKRLYDEIQERTKNKGDVLAERDVKSREMSQKGEKIREAKEQKKASSLSDLGRAVKKALIDENTEIISRIKKAKREGKISDEALKYKLEEKAYIPSEILAYKNRIDEEIIKPLEKNGITIEDVGEKTKYRRIATERAEIANPLGHTKETAEKQLALLKARLGEGKYAELEAGIKKFWEIRRSDVISLLKEADMYSDALMKKIENNENYVTFNVLDAMEKEFGRSVTGQIYKQIGTLHEIENPFVATVLKDASLIRAARMNNIKKAISAFLRDVDGSLKDADTRWNGKFQEPMEPREPNLGLLTYMEKGKIKAYYVPKEIADTFKYDPRQANIITKIWQTINVPVRAVMVSHNPIWMARNIVRDFLGTVKHLEGMTAPKLFKYYGSTIKEAARSAFLGEKTENVQKMLKERMLVPDRQFEMRDISTEAQIERIMDKVGDSPVRYRNFVATPFVKLWDYLGRMGQFTERWAKLAGYEYLKDVQAKKGLTDERIGHLVRTRVGTPDMYRKGSLNAITNNIFLFSNISKEGWRSSYEALKEMPAEYTWKSIKFNAIPKMILFAGLAGAFGDEIKKILEGISDYDKENYVIVPLGKTPEGKSVFFRIPQDYTGQVVGALTWDMLNGRIAGKKGAISTAASQHPYQWNPIIEVAGDAAQYALHGLNPYDEYFGGHVLDETVYKAGGARAWEDLAKYSAKQLGAKAIYDFKGTSVKEVEGEMEKALKYPGMSVLGTFLKVSDLGHKEKLREVKEGAEKEVATRQIAIRDRIIESINAATDEGKKPGVRDVVALYKELKNERLIDPMFISIAQFRHKYDRYASKAKNSIEIDAVINAATNEEKAALLKHYKESMGKQEYRDILGQLMREGFNPRGAMLKMRLKERENGEQKP